MEGNNCSSDSLDKDLASKATDMAGTINRQPILAPTVRAVMLSVR